MKNRLLHFTPMLAASLFLLVFSGCGGGYGGGSGGSGSRQIVSIMITPAKATIAVSDMQQYKVVAKDASGNTVTNAPFQWKSSDTAVATVNGSGLATGVAAGKATITATITYTGGTYNNASITSNEATLTVEAADMAMGTVATGRALPGALVTLKDAAGRTQVTMTDGNGRFQISTGSLTAPFLVKADDNRGRVLFSFGLHNGVVNVDPFTDALVRLWFKAHKLTPRAAFLDMQVPMPDKATLKALDRAMVRFLVPALQDAGLDPARFSLITTPFAADHTGFDRVLDRSSFSVERGSLSIRHTRGLAFTATGNAAGHSIILENATRTLVVKLPPPE